jgi:hypothetical protein
MIEAFSRLTVGFPGGRSLDLDLEGDLFELEDQRNWTDASFKTYPTPLARSEPRVIEAGTRVLQRADFRVRGDAPPVRPPGPIVVSIGEPTGMSVPPIGMSVDADPIPGAAHTRVELVAADPDTEVLARASAPIELALVVDPASPDVTHVVPRLRGVRLARLLVLRADQETSTGDLVGEVRARLGTAVDGVPVLGGTSTWFSELNRNPPDAGGDLDGVAFAISPEVHAVDERSVRETLEIQAQVVRNATRLAGGRPVHVSPVRLASHRGTAFAEAWTVGSLAQLVGAGAASITIDASSRAAAIVASLLGAAVLDVRVSDQRRVAAVAVRDGPRRRLLVANLTGDAVPLLVDDRRRDPLWPYEVWVSEDEATASS